MNIFKRLFGDAKREDDRKAETAPIRPAASDASAEPDAVTAMLETTAQSRDAFYASLGAVEPDVLAPLINPAFMGGPAWPALRQAWSVIRRRDTTLVASNGLTDPFDQTGEAPIPLGFRLEVFAETRAPLPQIQGSWLFDLTYQVSQNVADHGQFNSLLERYGVLSMLLPIEGLPPQWLNSEGQVALLIGLPATTVPSHFATAFGDVRMAALTLLRPEELAFMEKDGQIASNRRKLADIFASYPHSHINDLGRAPMVMA